MILNGDIISWDNVDQLMSTNEHTSLMIARGAMWNPSIFARDKAVEQIAAVKAYIKKCVEMDNLFQNSKYTVMRMYEKVRSEQFQQLAKSKSLQAICEIFGLEQYYNEILEKRAQILHQVPNSLNTHATEDLGNAKDSGLQMLEVSESLHAEKRNHPETQGFGSASADLTEAFNSNEQSVKRIKTN